MLKQGSAYMPKLLYYVSATQSIAQCKSTRAKLKKQIMPAKEMPSRQVLCFMPKGHKASASVNTLTALYGNGDKLISWEQHSTAFGHHVKALLK